MIVVLLMIFVVNMLLLFAAGRLLGEGGKPLRIMAAAAFHTLFAAWTMIPGFGFLGHILWRLCGLSMAAFLAFGFSRQTIPKLLLFSALSLSLGGVAGSKEELFPVLMGSAGMALACILLGRGSRLIPVELTYGTQTLRLTALRDTGNTLRDPITGKAVLIVDASVARRLTGLEPAALRNPVQTLASVPGLRLVPYQTVGDTGLLLALHIPKAKIGSRQGSAIVAFSPQILGTKYQALTGGTL